MEPGRQILRWGMPGGVTGLVFALCSVVAILVALAAFRLGGPGSDGLETAVAARRILLVSASEQVLAWAGGSIVLGFLLHQAYYWIYWYAPLPQRWFLGQDRARVVLRFVKDDWLNELGVVVDRHTAPAALKVSAIWNVRLPWRIKDRDVMMEYKRNWQTMNAIWYRAMEQAPGDRVATAINAEARYMSDVYHSLGVSVVATILGTLLYTFTELVFSADASLRYPLWVSLLSISLNTTIAYLLIRLLRRTRHSTLGSLISLKQHFLACALPKEHRVTPDPYRMQHLPDLPPLQPDATDSPDPPAPPLAPSCSI
ncbi:MAG TPA: hypothetical protein VM075_09460 [Anaerolineae bacterium]|nr:hypothetical protein [Anaerolineae bacterium]